MNGLNIEELEDRYIDLIRQRDEIEEEIESLKNEIIMEAELTGVTKYIGKYKVFNYIAERCQDRFDTTAFKKDDPLTYNTYLKKVNYKACIQVKDNKKKDNLDDDLVLGGMLND